MSKTSSKGLNAAFQLGDQPILEVQSPTPEPTQKPKPSTPAKGTPAPAIVKRDHRANRQAFTVWLDKDLIAELRHLSKVLVNEHGRAGNSIETLVTQGIEHVLEARKEQ